MKIKSELYLHEIFSMLDGINLKAEKLFNLLKAEKRKAQFACFFAPWTSSVVSEALMIKVDAILKEMNLLSDLREKIMQSEGLDDDMNPVTLEEMLKMQSSKIT